MINTDIITGMFSTEEKRSCAKFISKHYNDNEVLFVHMTPKAQRVIVEVTNILGEKTYHNLKKKNCGNFEEHDMPMQDR